MNGKKTRWIISSCFATYICVYHIYVGTCSMHSIKRSTRLQLIWMQFANLRMCRIQQFAHFRWKEGMASLLLSEILFYVDANTVEIISRHLVAKYLDCYCYAEYTHWMLLLSEKISSANISCGKQFNKLSIRGAFRTSYWIFEPMSN